MVHLTHTMLEKVILSLGSSAVQTGWNESCRAISMKRAGGETLKNISHYQLMM